MKRKQQSVLFNGILRTTAPPPSCVTLSPTPLCVTLSPTPLCVTTLSPTPSCVTLPPAPCAPCAPCGPFAIHAHGFVASIPTATIGATYVVPLTSLPVNWREADWYTQLTLERKANECADNGPPEPLITTFEDQLGNLHLPRFEGRRLFGPCIDVRSNGESMDINVVFAGKLCSTTPPQVQATNAVMHQLEKHGGAMLILPCGFGKTVCALWLAHALNRRALVIVNSSNLLRQWKKRVEQFLPLARIGVIQQDVAQGDNCDVVIAMLQSLSKKQYADTLLAGFGTVIVDEAHHIAAPMFSRAMRKLPARNIIGLSATPDRPDGLGIALNWFMGVEAYRAQRVQERVDVRMITYTRGNQEELVYRNGKVRYPEMVNRMVADVARQQLVHSLISRYYAIGRHVLVLCDRREQVTDVARLLAISHPLLKVGVVLGGMKEGVTEPALSCQVIVSTYHYFSEGADVPRLDTLILATPRGNIEQALGRILRPHPEKATPLVVDICDSFSLFAGMMWKRHGYYRKNKYWVVRMDDSEDVQTLEHAIL